MALFWKAAAAVLITVVLQLALASQRKEIGILLTITVCCMVCMIAITYLEPVLEFLRELEALGDLHSDMLGILIKAAGIGLVSETAGMICTDAGNSSLGKTVQFLGSTVILCLSLPMLRSLLDLLQKMLGQL